jgi:hypothetical protein
MARSNPELSVDVVVESFRCSTAMAPVAKTASNKKLVLRIRKTDFMWFLLD